MLNIAETTWIGLIVFFVFFGISWVTRSLMVGKDANMGDKINNGMAGFFLVTIILLLAWIFGCLVVDFRPAIKSFVYS